MAWGAQVNSYSRSHFGSRCTNAIDGDRNSRRHRGSDASGFGVQMAAVKARTLGIRWKSRSKRHCSFSRLVTVSVLEDTTDLLAVFIVAVVEGAATSKQVHTMVRHCHRASHPTRTRACGVGDQSNSKLSSIGGRNHSSS